METRIHKNMREEIVVGDIPIGNVLLDNDGKAHWAELYSDFIHTRYEAKLLKQFCRQN